MVKKRKANVPLAFTATHKVLPYIQDFTTEIGYAPTQFEVGKAFKKSAEWARLVIGMLVKAGYLSSTRKVRGISLTKKGIKQVASINNKKDEV